MNAILTRSDFLRSMLASTLLLVAGCSEAKDATACENFNSDLVRANVQKKLQEKFPQYTFEIGQANFSPKTRIPFWHVEAITNSTGKKLMIFAMHYCEGSVELTALVPYEP